jgi:integrase
MDRCSTIHSANGNPQAKKVGEYLARWVREIGVTDLAVLPNHGWRHRFKTQARLANMDPEIRDVIQGHSPRTVGEAYGDTTPVVSLREISKLPWYSVA